MSRSSTLLLVIAKNLIRNLLALKLIRFDHKIAHTILSLLTVVNFQAGTVLQKLATFWARPCTERFVTQTTAYGTTTGFLPRFTSHGRDSGARTVITSS